MLRYQEALAPVFRTLLLLACAIVWSSLGPWKCSSWLTLMFSDNSKI